MSSSFETDLPLAPLGAGDLIDRAVRLYRRHLFVLIRTAAPPVLLVAAGWILFSISIRRVLFTPDTGDFVLNAFHLIVSILTTLAGYLLIIVVMGGATRTLVAHLLRNDPVTARATYNAVRSRLWGLIVASLLVLAWIFASVTVAFIGWEMVAGVLSIIGFALMGAGVEWLGGIIAVLGVLVATALAVWLFFFVVARIVYVPQAMLVEGKGVFDALGRSFSLARGNVRRFMAMTLFTTFATLSALMILFVIINLIGKFAGVNPVNSAEWPAWYAIAYSILGPLASILLTPVWMLGLSLLYLDERVRHEGYDIELMAAKQLGELPDINVTSPLGTALHSMDRKRPPAPPMSSGSILNLSQSR
jgi:hypothetical protein